MRWFFRLLLVFGALAGVLAVTLAAGLRQGLALPYESRNGGCGVCKVQSLEGQYSKRVMSRAYVSAEEEAAGIVLACRVKPRSDIRLTVLGKMKKNVCATPSAAAADARQS